MNKKNIISIAVIFVIIAVGFAWWQLMSSSAPKYTGSVEKIIIANFNERSALNLIAKEKGFFKENGLDAEIKEYTSGPPAVAALLAGEVNIAPASDFVGVGYIFANNNLRILARLSGENVFQVIARKDKGISRPADLKGKMIGLTKKTVGEFLFGQFLIANGLSHKDVTIVDLPAPEIADQIAGDKVDAVVAFEPHVFNIQKKLGNSVISWSIQENQKFFLLAYSTDEFIRAHPDVIERYLHALIKAERYIKENEVATMDLVAKTFSYDEAYVKYVWSKYDFGVNLEQALLLTMEDEARFAIANKLTDQIKVPSYLNFIYFNALTKVKPEAVTIIH